MTAALLSGKAKTNNKKKPKKEQKGTNQQALSKNEARKGSRIDEALVRKAVVALVNHHQSKSAKAEKQSLLGTDALIHVTFGLEIAPIKPSRKPICILIPHPIHKVSEDGGDDALEEPEVCLIVKDDSKAAVKEMIEKFPKEMGFVKKVLTLDSLRTKYGQFQQRRELLHQYSVFMADDRILPMLTKALGRDFVRSKRLPIPVSLTRKSSLPFAILNALKATFMTLTEGTYVSVRAGNTGMSVDSLAENVVAIANSASEKIPRKWANVRSISIKTPDSVTLPFYNKTPAELEEIAKLAGLEPVWKQINKENKKKTNKTEGKKNDTQEESNNKEKETGEKRKRESKSPLEKALKKSKQLEAQAIENKKEETTSTSNEAKSNDTDSKDNKLSKKRKSMESKQVESTPVENSKSKKAGKEMNAEQAEANSDDKKSPKKRKSMESKEVEEIPVATSKSEKAGKGKKADRAQGEKAEVKSDDKQSKEQSDKKSSKKRKAIQTKQEETKPPENCNVEKTVKTKSSNKKESTKKAEQSSADRKDSKETKQPKSSSFIASSKFNGAKKGYVFRKGPEGLGYYVDVKPIVNKQVMESILRMSQQRRGGGGGRVSAGKRRGRR